MPLTFCPKGNPKVATVNSYEPWGIWVEGLVLTRITSSNSRYRRKKPCKNTWAFTKTSINSPMSYPSTHVKGGLGRCSPVLQPFPTLGERSITKKERPPPSPPRTAHIDMRPVTFGRKSPHKTQGGGGSPEENTLWVVGELITTCQNDMELRWEVILKKTYFHDIIWDD